MFEQFINIINNILFKLWFICIWQLFTITLKTIPCYSYKNTLIINLLNQFLKAIQYITDYNTRSSTNECFSVNVSRAEKLMIKSLKAGTHEGACSGSTLLQHALGAKLPRLHQRFLVKKYVAQQNFCSRVLLPRIKLV